MAVTKRPRGRPRADAVDKPTADGILDAAEVLFAHEGFGATSLRSLIEASRMSTTAFYARFDSKDAVLVALLERLMRSIGESLLATMPRAKSVLEGFELGVDLLVDALVQHRGVVKVALGEGAASAPVRDALALSYGQLAAQLEENFGKLSARGDVKVKNAHALAWAIVGALQMQVARWAVFGELDDRALRGALRDTAVALLPRGPD